MLMSRQVKPTVSVSRSSAPAVSSQTRLPLPCHGPTDKNSSPKAQPPMKSSSSLTSQGRGLWPVLAPPQRSGKACLQNPTESTGALLPCPGGCLEAPMAGAHGNPAHSSG